MCVAVGALCYIGFAVEPTLSAIRQTSPNYLSLPKGSHTTYGTSTTKSATHPYIVSIYDQDKQLRYFNPSETLPELNLALRYLARTGGGAVGLSNKTAVYYVIGDFVGNVAKKENGGAMNFGTDSTIKAIVGNFIGNYASDTGGAIFRHRNNYR